MTLIWEKFWDRNRILSRGILKSKNHTALLKLLQKSHYSLKLRTVLKHILEQNRYRSLSFTNGQKSGETLNNCTNEGSLSPRRAITDIIGCSKSVCNSFALRSGSAWDTLANAVLDCIP